MLFNRREQSDRSKPKSYIALSSEEAQQYEFVVLNNPVFMQGFALAPIIAVCTDVRTALMFAMVGSIIIYPTRIIGDLTVGYIKTRLRIMIYALTGAIFTIPALLLAYHTFETDFIVAGIYLLMLFLDQAVTWRSGVARREGIRVIFWNAFKTILGYSLSVCLIGTLREFLAFGSFADMKLLSAGPLPIASTVPGGFLIVGIIAAAWQKFSDIAKKLFFMGGKKNAK